MQSVQHSSTVTKMNNHSMHSAMHDKESVYSGIEAYPAQRTDQ